MINIDKLDSTIVQLDGTRQIVFLRNSIGVVKFHDEN